MDFSEINASYTQCVDHTYKAWGKQVINMVLEHSGQPNMLPDINFNLLRDQYYDKLHVANTRRNTDRIHCVVDYLRTCGYVVEPLTSVQHVVSNGNKRIEIIMVLIDTDVLTCASEFILNISYKNRTIHCKNLEASMSGIHAILT